MPPRGWSSRISAPRPNCGTSRKALRNSESVSAFCKLRLFGSTTALCPLGRCPSWPLGRPCRKISRTVPVCCTATAGVCCAIGKSVTIDQRKTACFQFLQGHLLTAFGSQCGGVLSDDEPKTGAAAAAALLVAEAIEGCCCGPYQIRRLLTTGSATKVGEHVWRNAMATRTVTGCSSHERHRWSTGEAKVKQGSAGSSLGPHGHGRYRLPAIRH